MKEKLGTAIKYIPLILLLVISGMSLFRSVVSGENGVSQSIRIWTNSISLVAIVGAIFSYYVFDLLAYRISGEKIDILDDFRRPKDKEKGSTTWNSALANLTLTNVAMLIWWGYVLTKIQFFFILSQTISVVIIAGIFADAFATYHYRKTITDDLDTLRMLGDIMFSEIAFLVLSMIARQKVGELIYRDLFSPGSDMVRIIALVVCIFCMLIMLYCGFLNAYYFVGIKFERKDISVLQRRVDMVQTRKIENIKCMIEVLECIENELEESKFGFVGMCKQYVRISFVSVKLYCRQKWYSVLYLLRVAWMRVVSSLDNLIKPERIRISKIRFLEVTTVIELLLLDMVLFVYLGSEDSCARFFELLSTVVVIPILLSSLASLKER